jgi:hypothetical protein
MIDTGKIGVDMRKYGGLFLFGLLAWNVVACGGGGDDGGAGDLTFQELCDLGSARMCAQAASCGSTQAPADCIAEGKVQNCAGGVEQYCGVGKTFQSSKARACLQALEGLACAAMDTIPPACTPEVLCSATGSTPAVTLGEACHAVGVSNSCDPKASLCYAAGTVSSCAGQGLCVGDSAGMTCAAPCEVDADCLATGPGLACLRGCAMLILNGYCVTTKAKAKFLQNTNACADPSHASSPGVSGWTL